MKPLAAILLGALAWQRMASAQFTGLGYIPGGSNSWASGVSADGSVVVGSGEDPNGNDQDRPR